MDPATAHDAGTARGNVVDGIVTPEAVVLELETAGFASRILAALVDLSAIIGIYMVAMLLVALTFASDDESTAVTVSVILLFALIFLYPIVFETFMRGRTPGKAAVRLRAVTVHGAPIGAREATLRAMGGVVDKLLPPGGITGALFVLATPRHQRVGDLIAGTIVIRDPRQYVPPPALWFSVPHGLEDYAATIDPTAITVEQYTLIRSFLVRVGALAPNARQAIAHELAERLAAAIGHRRDPAVPPERFLVCALARYQRRAGPAPIAPRVASNA